MHFAFIPYGKREAVERLLRDMEAQKHLLRLTKDGQVQDVWIQSQVRLMPFGVVEYVFPKEDKERVLNTLCCETDRYGLGKFKLSILRKMVKCDPIPEIKKGEVYLWMKEDVNIIPIGIREDKEIIDNKEQFKGWTHEAI